MQSVAYARSQGLDVTEGTIENLPSLLPKHALSVVTLFHVIEHLEDPAKEIGTIYDALPSGGYLVIETPDLQGYAARHDREAWELYYREHLWYFDAQTLQIFLSSVGFISVASGKRNFDQYNMSISESLRRLGILRRKKRFEGKVSVPHAPSESVQPKQRKRSPLCEILRRIFSFIVVALGRLDYVWVIVQKPALSRDE